MDKTLLIDLRQFKIGKQFMMLVPAIAIASVSSSNVNLNMVAMMNTINIPRNIVCGWFLGGAKRESDGGSPGIWRPQEERGVDDDEDEFEDEVDDNDKDEDDREIDFGIPRKARIFKKDAGDANRSYSSMR